jgi:phage shock protein A
MGLVRRFFLQLKVWLDAFLAPAEDPRQTFTDAHQRQLGLLAQVQDALAAVGASKKRLEAKMVGVREKLPRLEEQARHALIDGREDMARLALERRQVTMMELQTLEEQVREIEQEEQRLSLIEQRLATQIETFFAQQDLIAARYSAAEAQVRINEALSGISRGLANLGLALQEAEQKAEHMQARASAIDRLIEAGAVDVPGLPAGDFVDQQLGELDLSQAVEDQLKVLKNQIREGKLPPPAEA